MAEKEINGEMPFSTTSAELISDNHDILSELLIRLPAKSLVRFKSVSKHWRTLISDASFSKRHTLHHRWPQTSFLLRASPSQFFHFNATSKTFAPFNFKFPQINVRQSCNGLLLLECRYPEKVYYVFNPTTGESRNLFLPKREYLLGLFLAFDPSKSFNYKVVCLRFTKYSCNLYEISVYDSETHEWRHNEHAYSDMPPPFRDWVYSNNCIYALSYHGSVFCFDIEKLKFRKQPLEDFGIRRQSVELKIFYLLETYGRVHRIAHDNRMSYLAIHEIAETNGDWSVRHLNAFDCIAAWFDVVTPSKISFLGLIRGDRKEQSLVFHVPGMLMRYHFCRRAFDDLRDLSSQSIYEEGRLQFGYHDAYQFIESLAPV